MRLPDRFYHFLKLLRLVKDPQVLEVPREVDVGLTNICNLRCSFCMNRKISKARGFMGHELFHAIVDCMRDYFDARPILGLGLFGEDTLHPDFTKLLKYASDNDLKINISTNATRLREEVIESIIDTRINCIELSLYTLKRSLFNKLVGIEVFDEVLSNIHAFLSRAEESGFGGSIRLRPFDLFVDELHSYEKEFYSRYKGLNFERKEPKQIRNWGGCLQSLLSEKIYVHKPCSSPFERLAIDWDGEVRVCCQAMLRKDLTVGYVRTYCDLHRVWHGAEISRLREDFLKLKYDRYPLCRQCLDSRKYINIPPKMLLRASFITNVAL